MFDYTPTRERAGPERVPQKLSRISAGRCVCGLRQLLHQSGAGNGGGGLLGAHQTAFSPGARYRPGAHGRGAGLHRATLCGGEAGAAVGRRGRGVTSIARAGFSAGAHAVARVSVEDSRSGVAEERSRASGVVRTEELGRADALLAKMAIYRSTTTTRSGRCAESRSAGTTGLS